MTIDRCAPAVAWGRLGPFAVIAVGRRVQFLVALDGHRYVLKREVAVPLHLDMLRHLQDLGVPVAVPLPTDDGRPFATIAGLAYTLAPVLPSDDRPPDWTDIGAAIGRLHRSASTFDGPVPVRANLPAYKELAELPNQPIHGDCHLGNIVTVGGKVSGFLDFDELRLGPRLYDLAYLLAGRPHEEILPAAARLAAGYHAVNRLTVAERGALVPAMLAVESIFIDWFRIQEPDASGLQQAIATQAWIIHHQEQLTRIFTRGG
jgi:Ser/Thr protein kinase RdoA (MazF antagonist)